MTFLKKKRLLPQLQVNDNNNSNNDSPPTDGLKDE